jgi:hypothetical protein
MGRVPYRDYNPCGGAIQRGVGVITKSGKKVRLRKDSPLLNNYTKAGKRRRRPIQRRCGEPPRWLGRLVARGSA